MNRLMIATLCAAGLLGVPACATQQTEGAGDARGPASAGAAAQEDRYCLRYTGTRIDLRRHDRTSGFEQGCVASGGRVYTREDLERTGEVDIANALRKLDPAIR